MATPTEKQLFSDKILKRSKENGINPIEAIMDFCEETGMEIEVAATLINEELYERLEDTAGSCNLLKKEKPKKKGKKK